MYGRFSCTRYAKFKAARSVSIGAGGEEEGHGAAECHQVDAAVGHDLFDLRREAFRDAARQDFEELMDGQVGKFPAAKDTGEGAEENAEREDGDDERERHGACHRELAVLVEPVDRGKD